ncbi:hypothetical protein B381_05561 [Stutzerimonas stutzeri NF13]|uniref:Uncharacterized protein n=1 Tax=Stutzerimonas stutzeri NF13 TaxID=1212548 RepID=M2V5N8_STUST|nr:hypothetical protein B381_05561 [Stutzerimonas stutzeri NF13]
MADFIGWQATTVIAKSQVLGVLRIEAEVTANLLLLQVFALESALCALPGKIDQRVGCSLERAASAETSQQ